MISRFLYRCVFKRTSSFVLSVVVASVFFERAYDHACESTFEWINEGRLWMHIKHKYEETPHTLNYQHNSVEESTSNLQEISNKIRKKD
ncbi:cytochrome b-c1 complex subunit 9-like [Lasioglossum baleicum]|uniref:cytochrome b-c1 complex subunit 9-like n=1 Tax=Lasioglossum baleicum TaxID=434251 RepID=UPI003FCCF710